MIRVLWLVDFIPMSHDRMESTFNIILFAVDQFVTYSAITVKTEENITVSIASRVFYTPSLAGTELCLDYILSVCLSLSVYDICVFVFLVL
jgi:hypothetical protein